MKSTTTQNDALLSRARRLLHDHRSRAKKAGVALDYALADIRDLLVAHPTCEYCRRPLAFDASLDHRQPIARGGRHTLDNLAVCCWRCNVIKGQLEEQEHRELLALLTAWHPSARQDVERRLIAGGSRYAAPRTRGRK